MSLFSSPASHLPPPSNLRCPFGITVSCTQSGGGPIRRCACSCPTWRGRTPPSALCRQSWPRKWLTRPSYESRVVPRGVFQIRSPETLSKKKQKQTTAKNWISHINELLHFMRTTRRGESYSLLLFPFIKALDLKKKKRKERKVKKKWRCMTTKSGFGGNSFRSHNWC